MVSGLSCSKTWDLLDQVLNSGLLHWQADSLPLTHQGSPSVYIKKFFLFVLLLNCMNYLYILDINVLSNMICKYFPPLSRLLFTLGMVSFAVGKLFSLIESHLLIFSFVVLIFGLKSKNSSLRPMSKNLPSMFSSRSSEVLVLMSTFLVYLRLTFLYGVGWWSSFTLLHMAIQFSNTISTPFKFFWTCSLLF